MWREGRKLIYRKVRLQTRSILPMSQPRKTLTRSDTTGDAELRDLARRYQRTELRELTDRYRRQYAPDTLPSASYNATMAQPSIVPKLLLTMTDDESGNVTTVLQFRDVCPEKYVAYAESLRTAAHKLENYNRRQ